MGKKRRVINNNSVISGHNVIVTGGTFIQQNVAGDGRKSPFDSLKEATAPNALHDSNAEFDRPKCHPNTRIAVLKKIMNWAQRCDRETRDKYIMWLTGAAGAGKSAITKSFIEMCLLNALVLATFIFWRSDGTRNHAGAFVASIAYQIYHKIPATQSKILSAIEADPLIFTKGLEDQFIHLVMKPLQYVCSSGISSPLGYWRVIVIDGLDECGDGVLQARILRMIADAIRTFKLPIKFLIASRPEHEINLAFKSNKMAELFSRLYLDDTFHPDDDIRIFLSDGFKEITKNHPLKQLIPASWPSDEIREEIVRKSSGQFIYTATVLRYCQSTRHRPDHRLDAVNNLRPAQGDLPFTQLDELYRMILESAADRARVLCMFSIISHRIFGNFDTIDISLFMSLEPGELEILVCDLGSIISIEKAQFYPPPRGEIEVVKILHTSLHDFLLDPVRSRDYFLDIDAYRSEHIAAIIQYVMIDPRHSRLAVFQDFIRRELPHCQSSTSLINIAEEVSFLDPILREIEIHRRGNDMGPPHKMDFRQFVFWSWLPFCARMASLDERWAVTEKKHQDYVEQVFLNELPHYYEDDRWSLFLCVACHLGKDMCIPIAYNTGLIFPNTHLKLRFDNTKTIADTLHLFTSFMPSDEAVHYLQYFVHFLQHSDQSDRHAIGPSAYAEAALHCFKKNPHASLYVDEDKMLDALTFDNGQWLWTSNNTTSDPWSGMNFLFLGYLVFFLPRAGFSEQLVQQCKKEMREPFERVMETFPRRGALVRQEMKNYLDRVGVGRLPTVTLMQRIKKKMLLRA